MLDTYVHIGWLAIVVPFSSGYHRSWLALGTVGADLLLAVAISSAWRQHIPARAWRALHWLAYLSWPVAVSHALGMGTDRKLTWAWACWRVSYCRGRRRRRWRLAGALPGAGRIAPDGRPAPALDPFTYPGASLGTGGGR